MPGSPSVAQAPPPSPETHIAVIAGIAGFMVVVWVIVALLNRFFPRHRSWFAGILAGGGLLVLSPILLIPTGVLPKSIEGYGQIGDAGGITLFLGGLVSFFAGAFLLLLNEEAKKRLK